MQNTINDIDNNREQLKEYLFFQNYDLIKDNFIYNVEIRKTEKGILIKSRKYSIVINHYFLPLLKCNTMEEAFNFIANLFEENKVIIKEIIIKEKIMIELTIHDFNLELALFYYEKEILRSSKDYLLNEVIKLINEVKSLKEENNNLKTEINKLKKFHDEKSPQNLQLLSNVTYDSFAQDNSDNSFTVFNSLNDSLIMVYSNIQKSIITYNLNTQRKITEIKNAHNSYITNFRYYLDEINKRDIIMSLSCKDSNIKLWNAYDWSCILNLENIITDGGMYSACFLNYKNNIYIATTNSNWNAVCQKIGIYDLTGKKINEMNDSNCNTFFIESYYDPNEENSDHYLVTGNFGNVRSYDYEKNQFYKDYNDYDNKCHLSIIIQKFGDTLKIIESSTDGNIRIWDFHYGVLLNKIRINSDEYLRGICLFNDNKYLLISCDDHTIKIMDLKSKIIIKSLIGHDYKVLTIKRIMHKEYGECIVSQGYENDQIRIWINFMNNDIKYFC